MTTDREPRTERLNQRHKKSTMEKLKKASRKTHRTETLYVEHAILEQSDRDGVK